MDPSHIAGGNINTGQPLCKIVRPLLEELHVTLLYDPASPSHIPQRTENMSSVKIMYRNIHSNIIYNGQNVETIISQNV